MLFLFENYLKMCNVIIINGNCFLQKKNSIAEKYGVSGIPCFVILNGKSGELLTKDGRCIVENDDTAFFKPKSN